MKKYKCHCKNCKIEIFKPLPEFFLHQFVGHCRANQNVNLIDFEADLHFASVIHWDVGFTESARYYVYRNAEGDLCAWYDNEKNVGFKNIPKDNEIPN